MSRPRLIAGTLGLAFLAAAALLIASASPAGDAQDRLFGLWRLRHVAAAAALVLIGLGAIARSVGREAALAYSAMLLPVLLFGAALEAAGRVGLIDWAARFDPPPVTQGIGWARVPHQHVTGRTGQDIATRLRLPSDPIRFDFRTDRHGFRNDTDTPAEVIVLGDSIVLGAAVPVGDTVARQLARHLGRPVMQAALLGLSVQAEQDMLRQTGIPLAGRTVLQAVFEGNDLLDSRAYRTPDTDPAPAARPSLIRLGWNALVARTNDRSGDHTCRIDGQTHAFLWTRRSFDGLEAEIAPVTAALDAFAAEVSAQGGRFAVILVPTKYRVLHGQCSFPESSPLADPAANLSPLPAALADWSRHGGIALLDLTDALTASAQAGAIPWFWGDTHWNATGHAVAAAAIADWLSRQP